MPSFAYFQDCIVPIEEAKVSIMTHGLNYGTGCFEGIRAYWNEGAQQLYVFRLREHYERMHRSARILRIELPHSEDELAEITLDLLRREGYREDVYIRPLAYKADEIIGVRLHNLTDAIAIFATPFGRYIEQEEGAHVCFSSWRRVDDNVAPARAKICDEAVFTGTGVQVAAITRVEHRPLGTGSIGPVGTALREIYFDVVRGKNPRYQGWCTPVYGE